MIVIPKNAIAEEKNCQNKLKDCLKLEQECYDNYTKAILQVKENERVNADLIKQLNEEKKNDVIEKAKVGAIVGSVCIVLGLVVGLVGGLYVTGGR